MKKNNYGFYLFGLILLVSIMIFNNHYLYSLFWIIASCFLIVEYGFSLNRNYFQKSVIRLILISIFSYFIITYTLGLITGYSSTVFDISIKGIISNIWYLIITIISQELIRYIYSKNINNDKKMYIFLTIIYIFLTISLNANIDFHNHEKIFILICMTIIPAIANHTLYSYLTYKCGFGASLLLRLVFETYIYIFPIFPNLGNYLTSLFSLFYPLFVYYITSKLFNYYNKEREYLNLTRMKYIYIPLLIIIIPIIYLVSGIGTHQIIAIASGSMQPIIYRGDAIIYKKINSLENIKIGTVIAYKQDGMIVVHRVVGIDKNTNTIKTKGDYNNTIDKYDIKQDDVLGIVVHNIKYIGFPTIWLNERLEKI